MRPSRQKWERFDPITMRERLAQLVKIAPADDPVAPVACEACGDRGHVVIATNGVERFGEQAQ